MNKKKIIIVLIIIIALGLFSFLFVKQQEKKEHYLYLFTGDTKIVRWYYNNDTWYIANTNEKLSDKFDVYNNGKYVGNYSLMYNNKWYYFDDNNKNKQFEGSKFMINTNYDFNSYEYSVSYQKDDELVQKVVNKLNLDYYEFTYNLKSFDIYKNEKLSNIYFVDFYENNSEYNRLGPNYTIAFTVENDKIIVIKYLNFSESDTNSCSFDLTGIFSFENSSNKVLISCVHFDQIPTDYYLYEKKLNKYEILVDSKGGTV